MTTDKRDPKDPSQTSEAYDVMSPRWELISDLLGGTEAMRAAGEAHLPRHEEETDESYEDRRSSAVLLNMTEHTLESLTGKPFSEPVKVNEKTPQGIIDLLDDVDLQGNNLDVFCRQWFREGLAKCFCHVLVDFPKKPEDVTNLEQERAAKLRP